MNSNAEMEENINNSLWHNVAAISKLINFSKKKKEISIICIAEVNYQRISLFFTLYDNLTFLISIVLKRLNPVLNDIITLSIKFF